MSAAQRRIWHTYRAASIVVSAVNGIYTAYAFIYLKNRLQSAGGASEGVLDNLLVVIVGSMIFEFFAEPITGDWADTFGRKRMVVGTYCSICLAFLAYWIISSEVVSQLPAAREVYVIIALSLLAEVFYAVASALFNGALDAWFVDELRLVQGPQGAELLRFFAAQRRWSGVFMVSTGAASLWIASAAFERPPGSATNDATNDGLTSVAALPWLAAALITAGAALWAVFRLTEHRVATKTHEPSHRRILQRLKRTLAQRELRNALLVSSVIYTCWICFMYLLPVLLTEPSLIQEAGFLQAILKNYYWYYLAMGTSRFLGPYLSGRISGGVQPIVQFRWWGMLNCGALALAGAALLLRGGDGAGLNVVLVPSALVLFWVSKVAEEAFKPVRSTYLNYLIKDGEDRAFVLSMATPFGAILILFGVGGLAVAQYFVSSLNEVAMSVPLLFGILGVLGCVTTIKLSWSKQPNS